MVREWVMLRVTVRVQSTTFHLAMADRIHANNPVITIIDSLAMVRVGVPNRFCEICGDQMTMTIKVSFLDLLGDLINASIGSEHQIGADTYRVASVRKRLGQIHVELVDSDGHATVVTLDIASVRR